MPQPPMLDRPRPYDGAVSDDVAEAKTPFKLSQLDLGSITPKSDANKKREPAGISPSPPDDPEQPDMIQLLQQMQKVKQSKENKRRKGEIAAKAKGVASGVRRNASKQIEEAKSSQEKLAAEHRSALESLRVALEEEASRASSLLSEQRRAMKEAVGALQEKYDEVTKVQAQVELLGEYMLKHFPVVRGHVSAQIHNKVNETGAFS
ncbi:unnamed protein product [Scytosiphon promiscuus]